MNSVNIIGNLGRDPELRHTNSGKSVASLFVIVDRPGEGDNSDAIPVTVWNGAAEACSKYLAKGSRVGVTGSLRSRNFERQDGSKGFALELNAQRVEFLSRRGDQQVELDESAPTSAAPSTPPPADDDIPF